MSLSETLYGAANTLALLAWVALAIAPYSARMRRVLYGGVVVLFGLTYTALFVGTFDADMFRSFSTLEGLSALFSNPTAVLVGWIHYLAFDLLAGLYIAEKAGALNLKKRQLWPFLALTFMAGPLGWTSFIVFKSLRTRTYTF